MTEESLPHHLQLDAPALGQCDGCNRLTWNADEIGKICSTSTPFSLVPCDGTVRRLHREEKGSTYKILTLSGHEYRWSGDPKTLLGADERGEVRGFLLIEDGTFLNLASIESFIPTD